MNIVCVAACTAGIAHTYIAREKLIKGAKALGHNIKVETQGTIGTENELLAEDISAADVVILAVDVKTELGQLFGDDGGGDGAVELGAFAHAHFDDNGDFGQAVDEAFVAVAGRFRQEGKKGIMISQTGERIQFDDIWLNHPMPNMSEPAKKVCWLKLAIRVE